MANSISITSKDYSTNKTQQTTISGINPAVSDSVAYSFATLTADLSKDTFLKAERVNKVELSGVAKTARTISRVSLQSGSAVIVADLNETPITLHLPLSQTSSSSINLYVFSDSFAAPDISSVFNTELPIYRTQWSNEKHWSFVTSIPRTVQSNKVSVHCTETDTYQSLDADIFISVEED